MERSRYWAYVIAKEWALGARLMSLHQCRLIGSLLRLPRSGLHNCVAPGTWKLSTAVTRDFHLQLKVLEWPVVEVTVGGLG